VNDVDVLTLYSENAKSFLYQYDLDTNGIIYHLTQGNPRNPNSGVTGNLAPSVHIHVDTLTVASSGMAVGEACEFISREKNRCWTTNTPYSW
jgi:hypothetical protein